MMAPKIQGLIQNLRRLLTPGETLSQKIIYGGVWVFSLRLINRLFEVIRIIVLARLLAPEDFGLFGLALFAMSALEAFSQTGIQAALIQKKENIEGYLDTAWTMQAIRGAILALILFIIAPYVSIFFGQPVTLILRALGVSVLINGFANIGIIYFPKELEFHKQFIYMISGTIADLGASITTAVLLRNAWALVFGLLARNVVQLTVSYAIHGYRPRLRLKKQQVQEFFDFGRWVLGSSVVIFLLHQGDDILVARILGAAALGFYQMAFRISNTPATEISHVISQVTFPGYSKLQDNVAKLKRFYYITLQFVASLSIPMAGGILVLAREFTQLFLGNQWLPMVPAMQILSVFGATRAINSTMGPLFQGSGKPAILTKISTYQLILMTIIIYPLISQWGIVGAGVATTIANLLSLVYGIFNILSITKHTIGELIKTLFIPVLCTAIMIVAVWGLKPFLNRIPDLLAFMALVLGGTATYLTSITVLDRLFASNLHANMRYLKAKIGGVQ